MRIHNLFIAVIVLSLFAVVLASVSEDLFSGSDATTTKGLGISKANYTEDASSQNATSILAELSVLTETQEAIGGIASSAPSGSDSNIPSDDGEDTEGLLQKSGVAAVTKVGIFLFSVPRAIIGGIASYFNINEAFTIAAIAVFVLLVAIILVSSILRNRL